MQNKLTDLNNHLFAQLERLGDEELGGDKLSDEIGRAKAITDVAQQIIANANIGLKAQALMYEYMPGDANRKMPLQLRQFFTGE